MKDLFIYTNPLERFDEESAVEIKIQIDMALELGWKREDILIYTNFPYEYNGVVSTLVPYLACPWDKSSNKISVIVYLMQNKMLPNDLYWYHDIEAFQNEVVTKEELGLEGIDIGFTTYGYKQYRGGSYWNGGSFFFKLSSQDIFELWLEEMKKINRTRTDEKALVDMTTKGLVPTNRYKELNITYNFGQRCPRLYYEPANKPLN